MTLLAEWCQSQGWTKLSQLVQVKLLPNKAPKKPAFERFGIHPGASFRVIKPGSAVVLMGHSNINLWLSGAASSYSGGAVHCRSDTVDPEESQFARDYYSHPRNAQTRSERRKPRDHTKKDPPPQVLTVSLSMSFFPQLGLGAKKEPP